MSELRKRLLIYHLVSDRCVFYKNHRPGPTEHAIRGHIRREPARTCVTIGAVRVSSARSTCH